jgi:hypothetical protein
MTYKTGSGLDDWIYCTLFVHSTRDYRQYSSIADLHTLQLTITHALGVSVFTSHILATVSLSLQITHEVFFSPPNSFITIILQVPIQKTPLNSIPLLPRSYIPAGWRLETPFCSILLYAAEHFFITTLHGPRRKQPLLLTTSVYGAIA